MRRCKNPAIRVSEDAITAHVAGRIRLRRTLLGMSQSALADGLGITFQQVQKYERGSNRTSIALLVRMADILDVPLTFFLDGLPSMPAGAVEAAAGNVTPITGNRGVAVMRALAALPKAQQDAVAHFIAELAKAQSAHAAAA